MIVKVKRLPQRGPIKHEAFVVNYRTAWEPSKKFLATRLYSQGC